MADSTVTTTDAGETTPRRGLMDYVRQTEIDVRLFGMVIALGVILALIELGDAKNFLQPVNLVNFAVQATPVAIIACGMVLVIVTRQIADVKAHFVDVQTGQPRTDNILKLAGGIVGVIVLFAVVRKVAR